MLFIYSNAIEAPSVDDSHNYISHLAFQYIRYCACKITQIQFSLGESNIIKLFTTVRSN